jgi:Icc-related predicted phosphoesterase
MLKILHVTDLHGNKAYYKWVKEQSTNFDVICISGDLIGSANLSSSYNNNSFDEQKQVTQWLEEMMLPVFICSGNHDVITDDDNLYDLNLNDFDSSIDDTDGDFNSSEFSDSFNDEIEEEGRCTWLNEIKNKNIRADNSIETINGVTFGVVPYHYNGLLSHFSGCNIVLHHEPPAHTATAIQEGEDFGNIKLYEALKSHLLSPDYILCGHVHHPNSYSSKINKTIIYNPGVDSNSEIPNHRVITL